MDYTAAIGDASGAYLITDSQWAGYHGYPDAASAPSAVQDERATQLVAQLQHSGSPDPAAVASAWHSRVTTTDLFANDFAYYVEAFTLS